MIFVKKIEDMSGVYVKNHGADGFRKIDFAINEILHNFLSGFEEGLVDHSGLSLEELNDMDESKIVSEYGLFLAECYVKENAIQSVVCVDSLDELEKEYAELMQEHIDNEASEGFIRSLESIMSESGMTTIELEDDYYEAGFKTYAVIKDKTMVSKKECLLIKDKSGDFYALNKDLKIEKIDTKEGDFLEEFGCYDLFTETEFFGLIEDSLDITLPDFMYYEMRTSKEGNNFLLIQREESEELAEIEYFSTAMDILCEKALSGIKYVYNPENESKIKELNERYSDEDEVSDLISMLYGDLTLFFSDSIDPEINVSFEGEDGYASFCIDEDGFVDIEKEIIDFISENLE